MPDSNTLIMEASFDNTLLEDDLPPSKSQVKRDMEALQTLGEALMALSSTQWARLNLPERLVRALEESKKIHAFGALRRHKQYIGKLMRQVDPEPIEAFLAELRGESDTQKAFFHHLEQLRDQLIDQEKETLPLLLKDFPEVDSQYLRSLLRSIRKEQAENKPRKNYRVLFQYLKMLHGEEGIEHSEHTS